MKRAPMPRVDEEIPVHSSRNIIDKVETDNYKIFAEGQVDMGIRGQAELSPLCIATAKLFDVDALNIQGTYAESNVEVMKYLVTRHGANLNEKIRGLNLLHFAIDAGNLDMVEYLLTENYLLIEEEVDDISPFDCVLSRNEEVIAAKISCFVAARATSDTTVR